MHEHLVALGEDRAAHERELCRWLLAAERLGVHTRAGDASLREYAERLIGLTGRQTEERLRVGRALAELPLLDAALATRALLWSAVRELTRIATPQTENAWIAGAKHRRVQQIEKAVASRRRGARGPEPHVRADRALRSERRARQTVPPATRRAVMRRDRERCVVPGCNNHRFLDVRHLDPRSEGGGHDPGRLAVLCGVHHRAVHTGATQIGGTGTAGFFVHHGDGTPYGAPVSRHAVDVVRQVIGALESMGFKPTPARALVDAALRAVPPREPAVVLRAALHAS